MPEFMRPLTVGTNPQGAYHGRDELPARLALYALLRKRLKAAAATYHCYFGYEGDDQLFAFGSHAAITADSHGDSLSVKMSTPGYEDEQKVAINAPHEIYDKLFSMVAKLVAGSPEAADAQRGWFGGWHSLTRLPSASDQGQGQGQGSKEYGSGKRSPIASFHLPDVVVDLREATITFANESAALSWQPLTAADLMACHTIAADSPPPLAASMCDQPSCQSYIDNLTALLPQLNDGTLQKVVIGRSKTLTLAYPTAPEQLLRGARQALPGAQQGFNLLFQEGGGSTWLSVTPELLAEVTGTTLTVAPLAGTRHSSADSHHAAKLRQELQADDKERREHDYAADLMAASLMPITEEGTLHQPDSHAIIDLGYVQHLKSTITATLRQGMGIADVLTNIYPPATIWGLPLDRIAPTLASAEPFAREYFTGGYGYFGRGQPLKSRFALVIRCGKLSPDQRRLTAYAGSGIVDGSDPFKEWQETEDKMWPFTQFSVQAISQLSAIDSAIDSTIAER